MSDDDRLFGLWRTDPSDSRSIQEFGNVSLRFEKGGRLTYTIHLPDREQRMLLSYRVEGTTLVTDQESSPREDRAKFSFLPDGRLAIEGGGASSTTAFYVRSSEPKKRWNPLAFLSRR